MSANLGETAAFLLPHRHGTTDRSVDRVLFTPLFKENRLTKVRVLRQLILTGKYSPDGFAIAEAILRGNSRSTVSRGAN